MTTTALGHSAQTQQHNTSAMALMMDGNNFDRMERMATLMASSKSTLPVHFRGNPGDCMAVVMQAMQWGMNPIAVAQKTHLINGTLCYEGQLVAAVVNNSPLTQNRLQMEWFGDWSKILGQFKEVFSKTKKDDEGNAKKFIVPAWNIDDERGLGIRVSGLLKGENEPRVLELLMTQCRTRNSGLWTEDPKQQIAYLAQRRWARLYTPDVILGVYTAEELHESEPKDMGAADVVSGASEWPEGMLAESRIEAAKGASAYGKFWKSKFTTEQQAALVNSPEHAQNKANALKADSLRTVDSPAPSTKAASASKATPGSFANVMERLVNAKTLDELDDAAEWIGDIADDTQRAELVAKHSQRAEEIGGAA